MRSAKREPRGVDLSSTTRRNQREWDRTAGWFEARHGATLSRGNAMGWGLFHVPERRLHILGDVRDRDVLELGCGAARWSVALTRRGARVVGLDLSSRRLEQARKESRHARVEFPLLAASAESVPLRDASFDIVFCDFGAMTFADPYRTVPEAARVLRPGGLLAFSTWTPLHELCFDRGRDRVGRRLLRPYFALHRIDFSGAVEFQLPYGEWIRLFRENGLGVETLMELPAPPRGRTTFLYPAEIPWARRWPIEVIWRARKEPVPVAR